MTASPRPPRPEDIEADQLRDTARFLRRCRGTEPAEHFESHAIECERAAAALDQVRQQLAEAERTRNQTINEAIKAEQWHTSRAVERAEAAEAKAAEAEARFDFAVHLQRQRDWSERTFGPGTRTNGVVDHIRKELQEIEAAPHDGSEWADVVILGLDGFWRAGFTPEQIIGAIVAKQAKNEARKWPDWRTQPTDKAIEHDRSQDAALTAQVEQQQAWIATLTERLKRKNNALRTFGQHKASCRKLADSRLGIDGPCGCGLFAALAAEGA